MINISNEFSNIIIYFEYIYLYIMTSNILVILTNINNKIKVYNFLNLTDYNNKVYTVNDESQHVLIRGVPSVNLHDEVNKLCIRHGNVLSIRQVQFEDQEEFTNSFHVTFVRIQSARYIIKLEQ